jgi:hypothetical protein
VLASSAFVSTFGYGRTHLGRKIAHELESPIQLIAQIEQGRYAFRVHRDRLWSLAHELGVSVNWLLHGPEEWPPNWDVVNGVPRPRIHFTRDNMEVMFASLDEINTQLKRLTIVVTGLANLWATKKKPPPRFQGKRGHANHQRYCSCGRVVTGNGGSRHFELVGHQQVTKGVWKHGTQR